jgi:general secretion pathway protein D
LQLAEMLNGLFGGQSGQTGSGGVAAGSAPTQFSRGAGGSGLGAGSTGNTGSSSGLYGNSSSSGTGTGSSPMNAALGAGGNRTSSNNTSLTSTSQLDGNVRVVADEKRNALLIRAPRTEYRRIEQALRELDRAPMQVLIEASIVEVSLTGNLEYGVEWYLQNGLSRGRQGGALLDLDTSGIGPKVPGFSYTISKADVVRATLNAVSTKSQVRLLSSPSILVLNNHTANIQVGQQQPILTSTAAATGSNFITQSITYKDTGVLLSVTPSVNAGGLISMDISQQVTDVGERDVVTSQRSFQTRQIQTRVAVRSGESIVLGGLIRENDTNSRAGLPGLADVPLLGALFSNTKNDRNRTELLVLMTPRALEDDDQLRSASAEMRERMRSLSLQAQPMSFRPPDAQLQPSR